MLKKEVLRGKHVFDAVYKRGRSKGGKYIVVFYKKNDLPYNRIAFLASKKVGNSVVRHRAARLMRESYRHIKDRLVTGYDIIFIARNTIVDKKCQDVLRSMDSTVKKAGLVK